MIINEPNEMQIPSLRSLWAEAFGDENEFLDRFFDVAYSENRCRVLTVDKSVKAALYWFDAEFQGKKIAYLYAIATEKKEQGKGYCTALMRDTHAFLRENGYCAAMLCPANDSLFEFYRRLGYENATYTSEFQCFKANETVELKQISTEEYNSLRKAYLPFGGVIQEKETTDFLATFSSFYSGDDFIVCVKEQDGVLYTSEILGNTKNAPKILAALGYEQGIFRGVGNQKPFTMIYKFEEIQTPTYFGHVLD